MSTPSAGAAGLLGRIALHYKMVTHEQLTEATRAQGRVGNQMRIGEILLQLGFISREQLDWLLKAQQQYIAKQNEAQQAAQREAQVAHEAATRGGSLGSQVPTTTSRGPSPAGASTAKPSAPLAAPAAPAARAPAPAPAPPSPPAHAPAAAAPSAPLGMTGDRTVDRILGRAVELGASDIHIHSGAAVQMRVHGKLLAARSSPLDPAETERALLEILTHEQRERFCAKNDLDFAYSIEGLGRFRANLYRQRRGVDAVFRFIPPAPPELEALGLPRSLARLTTFHQGLVLVTGPAGCGKSSTLAALVNLINEERRDHIITVEDPIEYLHPSKRCLVNQRQVVKHTESFASALRAALREDPDVIVIGEMRDLETVSLAITAAETGHLVLATLHTNNAVRTINRILDVFPPKQQAQIRAMVSESLRAIVSQRLLPVADGTRRVPALEILMLNSAVANLIRDDKTFQVKSVLQTGRAQGMCLLDDSLADLIKSGTITKEVARRNAEDPKIFV